MLEAVQQRLDVNPRAMRQRRGTVEHRFATLKMRMGATHFLMKRLPKLATEMSPALSLLGSCGKVVRKAHYRPVGRNGKFGRKGLAHECLADF